MFVVAAPAFLAVSNEQNQRLLVEGTVTAVSAEAVTIAFEQVAELVAGAEVTLYADRRGKFFQQGATLAVAAVVEENRTLLTFTLVGDAVSAEQRGNFRTSAVTLNVPVGIDRLPGCVLADVSPEGVGVISPKPLVVGSTVEVTLIVDGFGVTERMKVQGAKTLPSGKLRFGLYVPGKFSAGRRTLEKMASHLQRVQLRRLSGAA